MEYWEPSERLLIDTGKPRKTCVEVAGRRTFRVLTFSQQSGSIVNARERKLQKHWGKLNTEEPDTADVVPKLCYADTKGSAINSQDTRGYVCVMATVTNTLFLTLKE